MVSVEKLMQNVDICMMKLVESIEITQPGGIVRSEGQFPVLALFLPRTKQNKKAFFSSRSNPDQ
jgi:hypothetical protein